MSGRRIMVSNLVFRANVEGIDVTQSDLALAPGVVEEALEYCSELRCLQDSEHLPLCQHCTLRDLPPEMPRSPAFLQTKDPNIIHCVEVSDCWHNWLTAASLIRRLAIRKGRSTPRG